MEIPPQIHTIVNFGNFGNFQVRNSSINMKVPGWAVSCDSIHFFQKFTGSQRRKKIITCNDLPARLIF